jgi:hypothetical protein
MRRAPFLIAIIRSLYVRERRPFLHGSRGEAGDKPAFDGTSTENPTVESPAAKVLGYPPRVPQRRTNAPKG